MISEDISFVLTKNRLISEEDREIYIYGIELLLTGLMTTGTLLLIGILFQQMFVTLAFMLVMISIRAYSGGYHANAYWKCYGITSSIYIGCLVFNRALEAPVKVVGGIVLLSISYIVTFVIASLNSHKNPKTEEEMKQRKSKVRVLISIYTTVAVVLAISNSLMDIYFTIAYAQFMVTILLMITILQRRYFK